MLSCSEIVKSLSKAGGEFNFKLENYNPLFEQSPDFWNNYLQLVEDKIKENNWTDPNIDPEKFKKDKDNNTRNTIENNKNSQENENNNNDNDENNNENEEEDLDNKSKNKEKEFIQLVYKENQTNQLPNLFLDLFNEPRKGELYYYGIKGNDTFLASILLGAETNYWLQHRKKKREYADQFKTMLSIQKYDILRGLDKQSIGNDFLGVIYNNDFPNGIDSDKSHEFRFLIGYYFKINILVLNLKELKGEFSTDWNPKLNTMIILIDNITYLPVLSNKISFFNEAEIKEIDKKFNIIYPTKLEIKTDDNLDDNKKNKKENKKENMVMKGDDVNIKTIVISQIATFSKYQLKDLQDIAEKLNISTDNQKTTHDNLIKYVKKTRKELYDDIINKVKLLDNITQ